jgi:outer membrane protein OmpU
MVEKTNKESIMTNIKKIGLSALAGSLAATSAFAGALDVTGAAKLTYVSQDETEVTGNPFSMSKGITFAGSGDVGNDMTINYSYTMSDAAFSASSLKLDMGDMGVASFGSESSPHGINAYTDKMPTAGEQVWDDLDGQANGLAEIEDAGILGYANDYGLFGVSASYQPGGEGMSESSKSLVLSAEPADGVSLFVGMGDKAGASTNTGTDLTTLGGTYTTGAITAGLQVSNLDLAAANSDQDRYHGAISFAVNEKMSVSYGMSTIEFESAGSVDQEDSGFAISYTMGSMTVAAFANASDNVGGTNGTDDTVKEISLAFAF